MIIRDIQEDWKNSQDWSELDPTRIKLRASNMIWHFLELPTPPNSPRCFVATGHIVCFDCDLCEEQGDVRFTDAQPVPWRKSYGDCCDDQEDGKGGAS